MLVFCGTGIYRNIDVQKKKDADRCNRVDCASVVVFFVLHNFRDL